jgi:Type VI secretion system/phage-baseplate injector OB domain
MNEQKAYYGKYRASVQSNDDPLKIGRLQLSAPDFPAMKEAWALPCTPYAGPNVGFYAIPPVGSAVWVEFEGGNPDSPIWSGCFWLSGQAPQLGAAASSGGGEGGDGSPSAPVPATKFWKTDNVTLVIDDTGDQKGGVTLKVEPPAVKTELTMVFDKTGILISCAPSTIQLTTEQIVVNHPQGNVTMKDDQISITLASGSITLTTSAITSTLSPGTVKISQSGVESTCGPSTVNVSTTGVSTTVGPASTNVTAEAIMLELGASSVNVNPSLVAINEDALVVI